MCLGKKQTALKAAHESGVHAVRLFVEANAFGAFSPSSLYTAWKLACIAPRSARSHQRFDPVCAGGSTGPRPGAVVGSPLSFSQMIAGGLICSTIACGMPTRSRSCMAW